MRALVIFACCGATACGINQTPQPEPVPVLPSCIPDRDGAITFDELPIAIGATAAYYTAVNQAFDNGGDGSWDLSQERNEDVVEVGPVALADRWYAADFPGAAFAVSAGAGLDGVYHQDAQGLWLHGIASREEQPSAQRTRIVYAPPLAVLRFPVTDGDAFTATATITNGLVDNLPFNGTDELSVEVAGSGRLDLPYLRLSPVLRVRTHAVRRPSTGTPVVTRRTTLFLFECFGEVARADSKIDETDPSFMTAAYLRRFALGVTP